MSEVPRMATVRRIALLREAVTMARFWLKMHGDPDNDMSQAQLDEWADDMSEALDVIAEKLGVREPPPC